jgi:hypothetical protein
MSSMPRADTVDAVMRARFRLVELSEACWTGMRRVGGRTLTMPGYEERVGPSSSIRLDFGEISETVPWLFVDTTWPGECGRLDAGNGYVQVFTYDTPAEEKARGALHVVVAFTNAVRRLSRGEAVEEMESDEEADAIDRAPADTVELPLDGEHVRLCRVRAFGLTAASVNLADRTVTVSGRFPPEGIALQSVADVSRYVA